MPKMIFVIYDTEMKTFLDFGAKVAWATPGAAKNAYNLHNAQARSYEDFGKKKVYFDDQTRYVLITLNEELIQSIAEKTL